MTETKQGNEELLRRYLLGEVRDEERSMVEQRLLTDQLYFNELLGMEEDLTDEYVQGTLHGDEREQFELHFASSPERRESVEFAQVLHRYLSGHSILNSAKQREYIVPAFLRRQRILAAIAACMVFLFVSASLWLYRETARLRDRVGQLQLQKSGSEQRERSLAQQLEVQRASSEALARRLESEQSELAKLRQHPADLSNPGSLRQAASSMLSLTLVPGFSRTADQVPTLTILPEVRRLRLELEVEQRDYTSYRVEVQTVEGDVVWSQNGLKLREDRRAKVVVLTVPVALLSRSDYLVMLSGISSEATAERVGTYYFKVVKKN